MARGYRTATTTTESLRIELSYLLREGIIRKGYSYTGSIKWTNQRGGETGSAQVEAYYTDEEKYIRLRYKIPTPQGEKEMDYKVELYAIPSNLGRGEVLYFVCPGGSGLCRILYLAPGSTKFVGRSYYLGYDLMSGKQKYRLYYPLQISSRISRENDRYWGLDKKLNALYEMRATDTYKGKKTRRAHRIQRLQEKQEEADLRRWSPESMPLSLLRALIPKDLGYGGE